MRKTAVIAAFAAGAQAQNSCGGRPVFGGYQPYMDKECKTKIPMPEDALAQTLDALNNGLGVLADKCMPAPDGKGSLGGRCSKEGFFINYYNDPKCDSEPAKEMPKEIFDAMKGQTGYAFNQCNFMASQGGIDVYGIFFASNAGGKDAANMEGGDDPDEKKEEDVKKEDWTKKEDEMKKEDWSKEDEMKKDDWEKEKEMEKEDRKKEDAMAEEDRKKEEAVAKEDPKKAEEMKKDDMKKEEEMKEDDMKKEEAMKDEDRKKEEAMKEEDWKKEEAMKEEDVKKEDNGEGGEKKYKIEGDGYEIHVDMEDGMEVRAKMEDNEINVSVKDGIEVEANVMDGQKVKVKVEDGIEAEVNMMDDYDISVKAGDGPNGGSEMTTEMKFDNYYMYGIDSMGSKGNSAPFCGPTTQNGTDACAKISNSRDSCCAHVLMTDEGNGEQTSMYRCMNQRIIDGASFSISIDGMQVAMQCSKSGSTYLAGAFAASAAAFVASTLY